MVVCDNVNLDCIVRSAIQGRPSASSSHRDVINLTFCSEWIVPAVKWLLINELSIWCCSPISAHFVTGDWCTPSIGFIPVNEHVAVINGDCTNRVVRNCRQFKQSLECLCTLCTTGPAFRGWEMLHEISHILDVTHVILLEIYKEDVGVGQSIVIETITASIFKIAEVVDIDSELVEITFNSLNRIPKFV
jgi:hypothetical protein